MLKHEEDMLLDNYDSRPETLVHEAVEEAVKDNPMLALEPYYQMKEAALILARRIVATNDTRAEK